MPLKLGKLCETGRGQQKEQRNCFKKLLRAKQAEWYDKQSDKWELLGRTNKKATCQLRTLQWLTPTLQPLQHHILLELYAHQLLEVHHLLCLINRTLAVLLLVKCLAQTSVWRSYISVSRS